MSFSSMISEASTIFGPEKEQVLSEKMRTIVESFRSRARTVKQRIEQPPTPTDSLSGLEIYLPLNNHLTTSFTDGDDPIGALHPNFVLDDFTDSPYASNSTLGSAETCREDLVNILRRMEYVDPRGRINICKSLGTSYLFTINNRPAN